MMVGLVVVLCGVLRLGWIADLLSVPVTTGFLAGIAIHIVVSQLPGLLGLPAESGETLQRVGEIATNLHLTNPTVWRWAWACSPSFSSPNLSALVSPAR